jgi:hypothetical protein
MIWYVVFSEPGWKLLNSFEPSASACKKDVRRLSKFENENANLLFD